VIRGTPYLITAFVFIKLLRAPHGQNCPYEKYHPILLSEGTPFANTLLRRGRLEEQNKEITGEIGSLMAKPSTRVLRNGEWEIIIEQGRIP